MMIFRVYSVEHNYFSLISGLKVKYLLICIMFLFDSNGIVSLNISYMWSKKNANITMWLSESKVKDTNLILLPIFFNVLSSSLFILKDTISNYINVKTLFTNL